MSRLTISDQQSVANVIRALTAREAAPAPADRDALGVELLVRRAADGAPGCEVLARAPRSESARVRRSRARKRRGA